MDLHQMRVVNFDYKRTKQSIDDGSSYKNPSGILDEIKILNEEWSKENEESHHFIGDHRSVGKSVLKKSNSFHIPIIKHRKTQTKKCGLDNFDPAKVLNKQPKMRAMQGNLGNLSDKNNMKLKTIQFDNLKNSPPPHSNARKTDVKAANAEQVQPNDRGKKSSEDVKVLFSREHLLSPESVVRMPSHSWSFDDIFGFRRYNRLSNPFVYHHRYQQHRHRTRRTKLKCEEGQHRVKFLPTTNSADHYLRVVTFPETKQSVSQDILVSTKTQDVSIKRSSINSLCGHDRKRQFICKDCHPFKLSDSNNSSKRSVIKFSMKPKCNHAAKDPICKPVISDSVSCRVSDKVPKKSVLKFATESKSSCKHVLQDQVCKHASDKKSIVIELEPKCSKHDDKDSIFKCKSVNANHYNTCASSDCVPNKSATKFLTESKNNCKIEANTHENIFLTIIKIVLFIIIMAIWIPFGIVVLSCWFMTYPLHRTDPQKPCSDKDRSFFAWIKHSGLWWYFLKPIFSLVSDSNDNTHIANKEDVESPCNFVSNSRKCSNKPTKQRKHPMYPDPNAEQHYEVGVKSQSSLAIISKYFLFTLIVIIWSPCIIAVSFCWLVSYPMHKSRQNKCNEVNSKHSLRSWMENFKCLMDFIDPVLSLLRNDETVYKRGKRQNKYDCCNGADEDIENCVVESKCFQQKSKQISRNKTPGRCVVDVCIDAHKNTQKLSENLGSCKQEGKCIGKRTKRISPCGERGVNVKISNKRQKKSICRQESNSSVNKQKKTAKKSCDKKCGSSRVRRINEISKPENIEKACLCKRICNCFKKHESIKPTDCNTKCKNKTLFFKPIRSCYTRLKCAIAEVEDGWDTELPCGEAYINTLKEKPCFCVYKIFPGYYITFLNLYRIMMFIGHFFLFCFAFVFWFPPAVFCFLFYRVC